MYDKQATAALDRLQPPGVAAEEAEVEAGAAASCKAGV